MGGMKTPTLIVMTGLALVSTSFAVDPPPDGGYPGSNTAEGEDALFSLTTGTENTSVGYHALNATTDGFGNTAVGARSLENCTTGGNTAVGAQALLSNGDGSNNVAIGFNAMDGNFTGDFNTAAGSAALANNTDGNSNCAYGFGAANNVTGDNNTAVGAGALDANSTGSNNIALGKSAGSKNNGSFNIHIGSAGRSDDSSIIRIGRKQTNTYIAGISGVKVAGGVGVVVDSEGHLGTVTSSARFKEKILPMATSSEAIFSLKPVTFRYKKDLDPDAIPQFGLVAEDVAKVDPDLVAKDDEGKPFTVRYEAVNAMLLNEFLKEHKRADEQAKKVEAQTKEIGELKSALKEFAARLDAKGL